MLIDNFLSKYWIDDDIKDCSNNYCNNDIDLYIDNIDLINDKKLKDDYDRLMNLKEINDKSKYRNSTITEGYRTTKNISNRDRSEYNRYKNQNIGNFNSKETHKYINLQRPFITYNNNKKMYNMPSSCRISKKKSTNVLLDTYPKPRIKNLL